MRARWKPWKTTSPPSSIRCWRGFARGAPGVWSAGSLMTTDIYVVSLIILHWTVVLTVAIAAFIVLVMKGPAFVADAYPLDELDTLESTPGKGPR